MNLVYLWHYNLPNILPFLSEHETKDAVSKYHLIIIAMSKHELGFSCEKRWHSYKADTILDLERRGFLLGLGKIKGCLRSSATGKLACYSTFVDVRGLAFLWNHESSL